MTDQLDLQLGRQSGPVATPEEIERVCQFLSGRAWTTAREIEQAINIDERRICAIAEASPEPAAVVRPGRSAWGVGRSGSR